ncbi:hypothetical protein [Nocardia sp. NPDC051750]|uniref:hypothetical protein n=1 Tax=Nocardia sp. NPDC051750 TaxID=3364325 RepID=UPI0037B84CEF
MLMRPGLEAGERNPESACVFRPGRPAELKVRLVHGPSVHDRAQENNAAGERRRAAQYTTGRPALDRLIASLPGSRG